ncbi:MAG TPA: DUF2284 domain-containing protein, partial [Thermodesulfobacteriota bacterium]|nr:DUF2284 domain-containing protein [Thermodesulfobacteriota bacterium]
RIEKMAAAHGLGDFKWIQPRSIVLGEWVRMKCLYGCPGYGSRKTCPPFVPSVAECRDFFGEYRAGILFHFGVKFENPDMRHAWSNEVNKRMLEFEREVFLSGFQKAFLFPQAPCRLCGECSGTDKECRQPSKSRPTLEAFGVDVYTTARIAGFPIQVVKDYNEEINRYGLLLLE